MLPYIAYMDPMGMVFLRYLWISYDILGQMFGLVCQMSDVCFYGNLDSRTNSIRQLLVGQISPKFDSLGTLDIA